MSTNSLRLREWLDRTPDTTAWYQQARDDVADLLNTWGLDPEYIGRGASELPDDIGAHRYQYMSEYIFVRKTAGRKNSYLPVQFKSILYTTSPVTDPMQRYLQETHNGRLRALFDTGVYDGYMTGFNFSGKSTSSEGDDGSIIVPAREVPETGIGVPRWEVEVYYDSGLAGAAEGFSLDFEIESVEVHTPDAPQEEVWYVSPKGKGLNESRSPPSYEIGPKPRTDARERAKNAHGKTVYLAGSPIGTVTTRGTTWFRYEYKRGGQYTDRATILDTKPIHYNKLSPGAKLYKVAEDTDSVYLVADEPSGFHEADPTTVDVGATGEKSIQQRVRDPSSSATTFIVENDRDIGGALGRYDAGDERDITEEREFA